LFTKVLNFLLSQVTWRLHYSYMKIMNSLSFWLIHSKRFVRNHLASKYSYVYLWDVIAIQSFKPFFQDLKSTNVIEVCCALTVVCKLINKDMMPALLPQVLQLSASVQKVSVFISMPYFSKELGDARNKRSNNAATKTKLLHTLILGNKKQTSQKKYRTLIFLTMLGHMQKISHFWAQMKKEPFSCATLCGLSAICSQRYFIFTAILLALTCGRRWCLCHVCSLFSFFSQLPLSACTWIFGVKYRLPPPSTFS